MGDLKTEILQILDKAKNGGIVTREIFEFLKGGIPVCILLNETQKSIKEMQKATSELIDDDKILINALNAPDNHVKLTVELKEIIKNEIINETKTFLFAVIKINKVG
jgi:hypothetical protein